jgi:hypothetical protein
MMYGAMDALDIARPSPHSAHVPPKLYQSPLTGDVWKDARPAIGTIIGLANFINAKRPRRKPPDGHDAAIALATEAAGAFAGIPKITRTGLEGVPIADAYWKAKDAKIKLYALIDDGVFAQLHAQWGSNWMRTRETWGDGDSFTQARKVPLPVRAARLAFYAASMTEKAASNGLEMDTYSFAHDATLGTLAELEDAGVSTETAAGIERVWRFVVAAGRLPKSPDDDDLLAAFEAALMAGADEFATNLAKVGHGFVNEEPST